MVPLTIRRVTDLPPNAKLHELQQNTHRVGYPHLETGRSIFTAKRGQSISPTRKGPVHIPN